MRKKYAIANWKMNFSMDEVDSFLDKFFPDFKPSCSAIICPPFVYLRHLLLHDKSFEWSVGAQDVSSREEGAYTGEISAKMLSSLGVRRAIVGHSERRQYFKETNTDIAHKIERLREYHISPIFCVGESLEARESGNHFNTVKQQISETLSAFSDSDDMANWIIAYEPVWAIGTGKVASSEQAEEMHAFIREHIAHTRSAALAEKISILYGGSVKSSNAEDIFSCPNVDGALIGGASLQADEFIRIIRSLSLAPL